MIEFLQSLLIPLSILLTMILIVHKLMRRHIDAQSLYYFWLVLPVGLMFYLLPIQWEVENSIISSAITTFTITPSQWEVNTFNYWSLFWLVGSFIMLTFATSSYFLFRRNIKLLTLNEKTAQLVKSVLPEGLCAWQSESVNSPVLVGVLKPLLILPTDFEVRFDQEQQELILAHEICHFDRNDIYWNLIAYVFVTLFWFHPLVWIAYARFCRDQETSCDHNVLARKQTESRINYSKALIKVVSTRPIFSFAQLSFMNYGDKNMMLERINNIKLNPKRSKLKAALLSVTALTLVSGVSVAGANLTGNGALVSASIDSGTNKSVSKLTSDVQPIVRIEPRYPLKAAQEGIEGAVLLKFDVDLDGSTKNVSVLQAIPNDIFNKESIAAIEKWKYKPDTYKVLQDNVVQLDFRIDTNSTFESINLIEKIKVSNH
ncbi:M56 family metallopeptidase [Thalassotalea piscium]|uniref:Protein TonB n=1 Tax=Thalassotalea piscium TaxID=1230533 RepID=A0A7X0NK07_9GAMM|nr:M56 family metallopeptidase [Thalassotalea piscium]MBB6544835.1 TonB family protein [Thalassotalea piscium]